MKRRYDNFRNQPDEISKYVFLSALQNRNETLFYRLVSEHITEMMPYIYTPTVGAISLNFSLLFRELRGLYLSYPHRDQMKRLIDNCDKKEVDVIVITDGERILGLGDLGVGGMAIPVGKLALYTLFGGIDPRRALPVILDVGTNNPTLLNDAHYIGWRNERVRGEAYADFVETFVKLIQKRYPNVLLQWEDFGRPNARPLLEKYRDRICSFNDDIQGTAAVALAAMLTAVKLTKTRLKDQRIVLLGAGSAGLGICSQLVEAMMAQGLSEQEARKRFYLVDINGLIHAEMDNLDPEQRLYARDANELSKWKVADRSKISLLDAVENGKPTILIGVSTQRGAFTEEIVTTMAQHVERPVIFPLSNPNDRCEANPNDLIKWTNGQAIIATGSPFAPVSFAGKTYPIAQCNNVYIFPGVGLGVIASKATKVTNRMFLRAAQVLSEFSPMLKNVHDTLFPNFEKLQEISRHIAIEVAHVAQDEGVSRLPKTASVEKAVEETMWHPTYRPYRLATH